MREINLTEGNDAKLNALMKRRGELFPVELSEEVKAEVVSRIGTRTACSCVVIDKGRVLVDISGELPSGGYILAVYGVLDGHKWRSACRGLHITKVTMPGIGNGMIAEGDPYDIEMEVEMYIQPSSNEAIRIHNEDGEAHADIRRMIPKIPANIVTDENYHHTDENYTSYEKEKLARLENYDDTQIRQMIAETSGNFVNYYQKKDSYSKLQVDNMLQAIKNGMFVTYEGEELPEPTEDWIGKILLFRNEVPLEELPEEEEPIVDPDQPIHEPEEVIEDEEIVDGNRGLRNTRTAPESTNYYEEYIVVVDEVNPIESIEIDEETGDEMYFYTYPLKWECIGSVKIDLSGYSTTEEMIAAILEAAKGKVDKVTGKGLSTNDYTNQEKEKLATLEEQVQADWDENDILSKAHVKNRTHYTEIISGEPVVYDSISWNRFTDANLRFEEDGYGTDEGGTYLTLQPSVITSNMDEGTQEKRFSKPIVFKLDDDTNIASAIVDKAQIRVLQNSETSVVEYYFYKIDKNTNKLYYIKTYKGYSITPSEEEVDIINGYVNLKIGGGDSGCILEALDFTETEIVHKLDSKFLNLDEEVDQESENPVKNRAVHTYVKGETWVILNSILELLNSGYYDKVQVDELLKAIATGSFVAVETLPQPSKECLGKIYLIPHPDPEIENLKDEYICIPNPDYVEGESEAEDQYKWEIIGSTKIDLSNYYTKSDVDDILKASQADWNASDVDSLTYIKNRTHYEEKDAVIQRFIDEEVSVELLSTFRWPSSVEVRLHVGNDYQQVCEFVPHDDGESYNYRGTGLKYNGKDLYLGGMTDDRWDVLSIALLVKNDVYDEDNPYNPDNFIVINRTSINKSSEVGDIFKFPNNSSYYTTGDIIKKLDPKYLPDIAKIPDGGTTGQILTKKTDADQDVEWKTPQQDFLLLDFDQNVNVNVPAIASGSNPVNIDVNVPESYQANWKISSLPKFECKNGTTRVDVVFGSAFSMNGQKTLRLRTFACGTETKQITSIAGAMLLMKR